MEQFKIAPLLKAGAENPTSFENIKNYWRTNKREILAQIERERRQGVPIMSKKTDGGGYWLAGSIDEIQCYSNCKKNEVITVLETILAMENGKQTPLPTELEKMIMAL